MIPKEITKEIIIRAIEQIDENLTPKSRLSRTYYLKWKGKTYPPKYVLSIASKIAVGRELAPDEFSGGLETNTFLEKLGFDIVPNESDTTSKEFIRISTVVIESKNNYDLSKMNKSRQDFLKDILEQLSQSDIVLLPGGFLVGKHQSKSNIDLDVKLIQNTLNRFAPEVTLCFGIDFDDGNDQLALAVNRNGLIALGRKFSPTKMEAGIIRQATSPFELEYGYSRTFKIKGKVFYLAVCYDCFGICHEDIENPGIDAVLVLSHQFQPRGKENSGDVDFVRKGVAGVSNQWNCPAFVSSVFFDRDISTNWPTGVLWSGEGRSVKTFKYDENRLHWNERKLMSGRFENAVCYSYDIFY